jgi:hypothetical protein
MNQITDDFPELTKNANRLTDQVVTLLCQRLPMLAVAMKASVRLTSGARDVPALRKIADEIIGVVIYETCPHSWTHHKNPDSPDSPGEYTIYCEHCGSERQEI